MKLHTIPLYAILLFFSMLFSCGSRENTNKSTGKILQIAKGAPGEIILVIDSSTYQGIVGDAVRKTFKGDIEWLSRPQSQFTLRVVQPHKVNNVLRGSKNLIYVTVINDDGRGNRILRNSFTQESIEKIKNDPSIFMFTKQDEFARGQEVMHLFGLTPEALAQNLEENRDRIRDHFNQIELTRMQEKLFSARREKGVEAHISNKFGCSMKIPYGYEIAIEADSFIWVRFLDPEVDRSITISYTDYNSQEQFKKDSIIAYRNRVNGRNIFGDPENPNSFMVTEVDNFSVFTEDVNFSGNYAVKTRGLWKTNNISMGGPFLSYAIVDESQGRLFYIEGFLYSPGRQQREFVRELDAILQTFKANAKPGQK